MRPTESLSLHIQQGGRGLRAPKGLWEYIRDGGKIEDYKGKKDCIVIDAVGNLLRHGYFTDEWNWSLDGKPTRADKGEKAASISRCPDCLGEYFTAQYGRVCPYCGKERVLTPREIAQIEGEMREIEIEEEKRKEALEKKQKRVEIGRARTREQLEAVAAARGYKKGWVDYIIKSREAKR